jgi:hypothetical protein
MFNPEIFEEQLAQMRPMIMFAEAAGQCPEDRAARILGMSSIEYRLKKKAHLLRTQQLLDSYQLYTLWMWCKKRFEQGQSRITVSEVQRNCNHRYRSCFEARYDIDKLVKFELVQWQNERKTEFFCHLRLIDIPMKKELETAGGH